MIFQIPNYGEDAPEALVEFLSQLPEELDWEGDDSGLRIGDLNLLPSDTLIVDESEHGITFVRLYQTIHGTGHQVWMYDRKS